MRRGHACVCYHRLSSGCGYRDARRSLTEHPLPSLKLNTAPWWHQLSLITPGASSCYIRNWGGGRSSGLRRDLLTRRRPPDSPCCRNQRSSGVPHNFMAFASLWTNESKGMTRQWGLTGGKPKPTQDLLTSRQERDINTALFQCCANVCDVDATLKQRCANGSCQPGRTGDKLASHCGGWGWWQVTWKHTCTVQWWWSPLGTMTWTGWWGEGWPRGLCTWPPRLALYTL